MTGSEYDTMDVPMLREVIQMLRQQLDKAQVDRNYVQHERVSLVQLDTVMSSKLILCAAIFSRT